MNNELVTKITDNIYRFNNQYFYGEPVGTYLIEFTDKVLLFDIPTYTEQIAEYLQSFSKPIVILLSHGSCGISDGKKYQEFLNATVYLHERDAKSYWLRITPDTLFSTAPMLDASLRIISTPGHSPGSICLYHKDSKTMLVGDTFGGLSNGSILDFVAEDDHNDDVHERLESCKKLLMNDFDRALPFHYQMILENARDSLQKFISQQSSST